MKTEVKTFIQRIKKESPQYFKYIDDAKELQNRPEDAIKFLKDNKGKGFVHIDALLLIHLFSRVNIYVHTVKFILLHTNICIYIHVNSLTNA